MFFQTSNCLILVPIALSLFVAVRLSLGSVDNARRSWLFSAVQASIVLMLLFGIFSLGFRAHGIALAWPVLLAIAGFVVLWKRRRLERDAMLQMAVQVNDLERQQALATFLAEHNVGWLRRRARELQEDLASGVSWFLALEMRGVARGAYERLALRMQHLFGKQKDEDVAPSQVMSPLNVEMEAERLFGRMMVLFWFVKVGPILGLMAWLILPTFVDMFDEFGIEMTGAMQLLISLSDLSVSYFAVPVFVFVWWILMLSGIALLIWLFPAVLQMPVFRWLTGRYYYGAGFVALSRALEEEKNLPEAFDCSSRLVPVGFVAANFRQIAERLRSGEELAAAMQKSGTVARREMELFTEDVVGVDWARDPVWGLRQLSAWKVERMLARYSLLVQVCVFWVTILTGVVIGFFGLAVISSLAQLILALD